MHVIRTMFLATEDRMQSMKPIAAAMRLGVLLSLVLILGGCQSLTVTRGYIRGYSGDDDLVVLVRDYDFTFTPAKPDALILNPNSPYDDRRLEEAMAHLRRSRDRCFLPAR